MHINQRKLFHVLKTMQVIKSVSILLTVLRHALRRLYAAYSVYYTARGPWSFFLLWREIRNRLTGKQTHTYMDAVFPAFKYEVYPPPHPCIQEYKTFNQSTQSIFVLDKEQKVSTTVLDQVSTTETRDCEVKFPSTLGLSTKWLLKREKSLELKRI